MTAPRRSRSRVRVPIGAAGVVLAAALVVPAHLLPACCVLGGVLALIALVAVFGGRPAASDTR